MNIEQIANKWERLTAGEKIRSIRIDSDSIPELYLGLHPDTKRCLVLKLPVEYLPDFQSSVKQNLSLELFAESRWVVLTLLDSQYTDLFDDLIFSIYTKISVLSKPSVYVPELLKTYYKWSEFFQDSHGATISAELLKGIFGELFVLFQMLKGVSSTETNAVLSSWKGPYDTGHDFIGEFKNTEVKTRLSTVGHIRISSEYQLQEEPGKDLDLVVVTIAADQTNGDSVKSLVLQIRDHVISKLGDYTILLKTLSQKGLSLRLLEEYDNIRYVTQQVTHYRCADSRFPRLIRAEIAPAIAGVTYTLSLELISRFISKNETF
ncbi:MAG: PD-(D/E)XK motif protein [Arcticibacter sp.]